MLFSQRNVPREFFGWQTLSQGLQGASASHGSGEGQQAKAIAFSLNAVKTRETAIKVTAATNCFFIFWFCKIREDVLSAFVGKGEADNERKLASDS